MKETYRSSFLISGPETVGFSVDFQSAEPETGFCEEMLRSRKVSQSKSRRWVLVFIYHGQRRTWRLLRQWDKYCSAFPGLWEYEQLPVNTKLCLVFASPFYPSLAFYPSLEAYLQLLAPQVIFWSQFKLTSECCQAVMMNWVPRAWRISMTSEQEKGWSRFTCKLT